jgi:Domain of unknown function (DUF4037)
MNEATRWRFALAKEIGAAYASNDNARIVMVAGSVGRGSADRYSDIEVDVYYAEPPTDVERIAAVERCGGTVELLAQDEDEWEERMSIGGFHAHTSTFLVATMERYLREVVDHCSVAPEAQTRLFSVQHGVTVKGEDHVDRWRAKAAAYPDGLQRAMLEESLRFGRFRYAADMLAARDDALALYEIFVDTSRQILGALLGLNRIYMPAPGYLKSMDETIALMAVKPADLSARPEAVVLDRGDRRGRRARGADRGDADARRDSGSCVRHGAISGQPRETAYCLRQAAHGLRLSRRSALLLIVVLPHVARGEGFTGPADGQRVAQLEVNCSRCHHRMTWGQLQGAP